VAVVVFGMCNKHKMRCCLQVLQNSLLLDPPKCPKCFKARLEGKGWRVGTHPVLDEVGQFRVFSYQLKCPGCTEHSAAGG
jgi:hypothetical protein